MNVASLLPATYLDQEHFSQWLRLTDADAENIRFAAIASGSLVDACVRAGLRVIIHGDEWPEVTWKVLETIPYEVELTGGFLVWDELEESKSFWAAVEITGRAFRLEKQWDRQYLEVRARITPIDEYGQPAEGQTPFGATLRIYEKT